MSWLLRRISRRCRRKTFSRLRLSKCFLKNRRDQPRRSLRRQGRDNPLTGLAAGKAAVGERKRLEPPPRVLGRSAGYGSRSDPTLATELADID